MNTPRADQFSKLLLDDYHAMILGSEKELASLIHKRDLYYKEDDPNLSGVLTKIRHCEEDIAYYRKVLSEWKGETYVPIDIRPATVSSGMSGQEAFPGFGCTSGM